MNDINELIENMREVESGIMDLRRVPLNHPSDELIVLKNALRDLLHETSGLFEEVCEVLEDNDEH